MADFTSGAAIELTSDQWIAMSERSAKATEKLAGAVERLDKSVDKVGKKLKKTADRDAKRLEDRFASLKKIAKQVFAGFSVAVVMSKMKAIGNAVVEIGSMFQTLGLQLETQFGERSQKVFEDIKKFALESPGQVSGITAAWIGLKAIGIEPTISEMRRLDDIASSSLNAATGQARRLEDLAEAVRGAVTGETERLKAFNIIARQNGESITLAYKDTEISVKKSAQAIFDAVVQIGAANFDGAAQRQMDSYAGSASNLDDAYDNLADTIFRAGLSDLLTAANRSLNDGVTSVASWIQRGQDLEKLLDELAPATKKTTDEFRNLALEIERSAEAQELLAAIAAYNRLLDELDAIRLRLQGLTDEELTGVLGIKLEERARRLNIAIAEMPERIDKARAELANVGEVSDSTGDRLQRLKDAHAGASTAATKQADSAARLRDQLSLIDAELRGESIGALEAHRQEVAQWRAEAKAAGLEAEEMALGVDLLGREFDKSRSEDLRPFLEDIRLLRAEMAGAGAGAVEAHRQSVAAWARAAHDAGVSAEEIAENVDLLNAAFDRSRVEEQADFLRGYVDAARLAAAELNGPLAVGQERFGQDVEFLVRQLTDGEISLETFTEALRALNAEFNADRDFERAEVLASIGETLEQEAIIRQQVNATAAALGLTEEQRLKLLEVQLQLIEKQDAAVASMANGLNDLLSAFGVSRSGSNFADSLVGAFGDAKKGIQDFKAARAELTALEESGTATADELALAQSRVVSSAGSAATAIASMVASLIEVAKDFGRREEGRFGGNLSGDFQEEGEQVGAAVGAVAGAIIGSTFGPVGTAVGAVVGEALGEVIGGVIGGAIKQGADTGLAQLNQVGDEVAISIQSNEGGLGAVLNQIAVGIATAIEGFEARIGAEIDLGTGGFKFILRDDVISVIFAGIRREFETIQEAIEGGILLAIQHAEIGGGDGSSPEIAQALQNFTGKTFEEFEETLALAVRLERGRLGPVVADLKDTIGQLFQDIAAGISQGIQVDGAVADLERLRHSVLGLEEDAVAAKDAEITAFNASLDARSLELQAMAIEIETRANAARFRLEDARAMGEIAIAGVHAEGALITARAATTGATSAMALKSAELVANIASVLEQIEGLKITGAERAAALARAAARRARRIRPPSTTTGTSVDPTENLLLQLERLRIGNDEAALSAFEFKLQMAELEEQLDQSSLSAEERAELLRLEEEEFRRQEEERIRQAEEAAQRLTDGILAPFLEAVRDTSFAARAEEIRQAQRDAIEALDESARTWENLGIIAEGTRAQLEALGDELVDLMRDTAGGIAGMLEGVLDDLAPEDRARAEELIAGFKREQFKLELEMFRLQVMQHKLDLEALGLLNDENLAWINGMLEAIGIIDGNMGSILEAIDESVTGAEEAARAAAEAARAARDDLLAPFRDALRDDSIEARAEEIRQQAIDAMNALNDMIHTREDELLIIEGTRQMLADLANEVRNNLFNAVQGVMGTIRQALPHIQDPEERARLQQLLIDFEQLTFRLAVEKARIEIESLRAQLILLGELDPARAKWIERTLEGLGIIADNFENIFEGLADAVIGAGQDFAGSVNSAIAGIEPLRVLFADLLPILSPPRTIEQIESAEGLQLAQILQQIFNLTNQTSGLSPGELLMQQVMELEPFFEAFGLVFEDIVAQVQDIIDAEVFEELGQSMQSFIDLQKSLLPGGNLSGDSDAERLIVLKAQILSAIADGRYEDAARLGQEALRIAPGVSGAWLNDIRALLLSVDTGLTGTGGPDIVAGGGTGTQGEPFAEALNVFERASAERHMVTERNRHAVAEVEIHWAERTARALERIERRDRPQAQAPPPNRRAPTVLAGERRR